MKIIGITGNSGSGKSYVSSILKSLDVYIIDTDKLGHLALLQTSPVFDKIIKIFGEEILDDFGEIDRKKLGNIVFSNKEKLKELENISHKFIKDKIKETIDKLKAISNFDNVAIDGALLIETEIYKDCDILILTEASYNTKLERIIKRDNLTYEVAKKRLNNQLDFNTKINLFDYIINTEKTKENILEEVKQIIFQLK